MVGWNDTTATVQSVKDSAGNTYSLAIGPTSGTALRQSIYYAPNILAGANTVTVTFSQAAAYPDIRILEYRGVNAVDVTAGAVGNSTAANSGAATTTVASELVFGADIVQTTTASAGSGFTSRVITAQDGDIAEDKVVTATGSNSATATLVICRAVGNADGDVLRSVGTSTDGDERESEQWDDGGRDGSNDYRSELRYGCDGNVRKRSGDQLGGGERDADYGNDAGRNGGSGAGDGKQSGWAERSLGRWIHLHCTAHGDQCVSEQRTGSGWHGGDDHGDELCRRRDGDVGGNGSDERGSGEQHDDHGDDASTCGGSGDGDGNQQQRIEWQSGQWIYLHRAADGDGCESE